jgi:Fe-S-cluster-containing hydrogenase component 2
MLSPESAIGHGELRDFRLFEGIPDAEIDAALASGGIQRRTLKRDMFVATPEDNEAGNARIYLVARGQVAAAVFDPKALTERREAQIRYEQMSDEEREELSLLPPPPLARVAKKNLASFSTGDLFNSQALYKGPEATTGFYSVSPVEVAAISHATIAELAAKYPAFEQRARRAIEAAAQRLTNLSGVKQEILDFFIRQGMVVSGPSVRVRQLDRCIDCKQCEEACEERHGSRRLTLGGFQLGMLDVVYTCRTCADPRCVDPCEYDSIKYDPERREVVINEASCVGCTLCARSCPYGAIEMVDVEDPHNPTHKPRFKARLEKAGKLAHGPGKPRLARPRRIANKCDHCLGYSDQACVSACPTGALIEVSAHDLFRERPREVVEAAEQGFAEPPKKVRGEILPTHPFTRGIGVSDAGLARVKRGRLAPLILWGLGLGAFFLTLAEILLRVYAPDLSVMYMMLRQGGMAPTAAVQNVIEGGFRPGNTLLINCGYIGTALMLVAILYVPLRRIRLFRKIASNTMWFDFHMMAGTVGPMFIVLHSGFKLDNWVSIAFWTMVIVAVSGVVGRYLYTQVPDLLNGRELEELDHERAFARLRAQHPQALQVVDGYLHAHRERAGHVAVHAGLLYSFLWIVAQDLLRFPRWIKRRLLVRGHGMPTRDRRELAYRMGRMMLTDRRRVIVPRAKLILHSWKKVHVPFSIIMAVLATVHIVIAFKYSM